MIGALRLRKLITIGAALAMAATLTACYEESAERPNMPGHTLLEGQKYEVRYRFEGQHQERVFVGRYIGWNVVSRRHDFSCQPSAPPIWTLPDEALVGYRQLGEGAKCTEPPE
jgi:hypothetical protein